MLRGTIARQKIGGKLGMRKRKKYEYPCRPRKQKQDGPGRVLPQFPPPPQAIPSRQQEKEAPREKAPEKDRKVIEDPSPAVGGGGGKSLQAFVPKSVSGEIRIAHGDGDKPGQGRGQKYQKPHPQRKRSHSRQRPRAAS